jgi:hypothetical protein
MQSGRILQQNVTREQDNIALAGLAGPGAIAKNHAHDLIATRLDLTHGRDQLGNPLTIGDDDLGQQAAGLAADLVKVEADHRLAGLNHLALADQRGEALALQHHGIKADMDQHLKPVGIGDSHCMPGPVQLGDPPGNRGKQRRRRRIDGHTVTDGSAGKDRVRHTVDWNQDAGKRREDGNLSRHRINPCPVISLHRICLGATIGICLSDAKCIDLCQSRSAFRLMRKLSKSSLAPARGSDSCGT